MAIRIFDQTVGQLAGISVVTTGKGAITNDGLEAYAQLVAVVDGGGSIVGFATEATLIQVRDDIAATNVLLSTPASYLPLPGAATSGDTTLTHLIPAAITTATTTSLVTATASQYTRVYRLILTCTGTNVITFKSNATAISQAFTIPSTGGTLVLDFSGYAWWATAANEPLQVTTTGTSTVTMDLYYIKGT